MAGVVPIRPIPVPNVSGWRARGWILALVGALALVGWDVAQNVRHYTTASEAYGVAVHAPPADAASRTGFADGRRTIVYPGRWLDAQHWIMQTQQMFATGEWRVRHLDDDNAPDGRPVHWGSPFRWWLGLCAFVDHLISGRPLGSAVEHAALYANPAMLAMLLAGLVPWVARRLGGIAAAFLALAMVGAPPFYVLFAPDNPDHHSLIQVCVMVCVVALLGGGVGWTRTASVLSTDAWAWLPDRLQARRAFAVSAVAGGIGMWVSAAGTIPVFVGIGVGALWSAWLGRRAPDFARFDPTLWRRWGAVGGVASLAAWLLEYFPAHLGWRLEVNHPLYALAWLGAGETLAQMTSALHRGRLVPERSAWRRLIPSLALLALPALAILQGGVRVFAVLDPFLLSLSHDYIPEGRGFVTAVARAGLGLPTVAQCLPMLAVVLVAAWLARPATPVLARAVVAIPLSAAALFWLMAFKELRWWTVGYGFLFGVVVVMVKIVAATEPDRRRRVVYWLFGLVLFAPGLADALRTVSRNRGLTADDMLSLSERDLAHALRQRAGAGSLVVLSAPATTSRMIYFGSARGLGTAYWENLVGLKRAAAIMAARTADEAHALVRAAGVTHIVLLSWDDFVEPYVRLSRGLSAEARITERAFGIELLHAPMPPPWLRQLPDHLPEHPVLQKQRAVIFEVTERTKPEEVLVRHVSQLLYRGHVSASAAWRSELERFPGDLAVQVTLARLQRALQDASGFAATLERVRQLLDQARQLEPDDRVALVMVFGLNGETVAARAQLARVLPTFDATALRQLTPGSLMNLLAYSRQLGVVWPDPRLRDLAIQLVPPDGRL